MNEQSKADLDLYARFEEMFQRRLAEIPTQEVSGIGKTKDIARRHFLTLGFQVFYSHARFGYRCIVDSSVHWHKLPAESRAIVKLIKSSIPLDEYIKLLHAVRDKVGTPDLLLLKDGKITFVEVKRVLEEVQPCTIRFFLLYSHLWSVSILRVRIQDIILPFG